MAAAAGIAAAFNMPLAGIVLGIEELIRSFESRTNGLVIGSIIAAGLTSIGILGDYPYFGTTSAALPFCNGWIAIPVCAVIRGWRAAHSAAFSFSSLGSTGTGRATEQIFFRRG